MPATFAHPAFSWPFHRLGLSKLALSVGAVAPDVAHLLPRRPWTDHTALSVVTFSVPLGFMMFLLVERWVLPALAKVSPHRWQAPLQEKIVVTRPLGRAVFAVALGAASHVALDHLTHEYGTFVAAAPNVLRATLPLGPLGPIAVYQVLQHGAGVLGTLALASAFWRWDRRQAAGPISRRELFWWGGSALVLVCIAGAWGHSETWWMPMPTRLHQLLVLTAAGSLILGAAATTVLTIVVYALRCK